MAIDLRQLEQRLHRLAETLAEAPVDDPSEAGQEVAVPHIELIDFDELRRTLLEAMAALAAASRREDDAAVVRNWLTMRVIALRRARRAFLRQGPAPVEPVAGDVPLPALLRCFEDETARWRAATAERGRRAGRSGGRAQREYLDFKS